MDRTSTRVQRRAVFPAGTWKVWAALTRPEELSGWFGAEVVSIDLRPGGRIVFRDAEGRVHRAAIEIVEAPHRLVFRWLPAPVAPVGAPGTDSDWSPGSTVELIIEEAEEGTALTVIQTPWAGEAAQPELVQMARPIFLGAPPPQPLGGPPQIRMQA